jgi:hypothetical protein
MGAFLGGLLSSYTQTMLGAEDRRHKEQLEDRRWRSQIAIEALLSGRLKDEAAQNAALRIADESMTPSQAAGRGGKGKGKAAGTPQAGPLQQIWHKLGSVAGQFGGQGQQQQRFSAQPQAPTNWNTMLAGIESPQQAKLEQEKAEADQSATIAKQQRQALIAEAEDALSKAKNPTDRAVISSAYGVPLSSLQVSPEQLDGSMLRLAATLPKSERETLLAMYDTLKNLDPANAAKTVAALITDFWKNDQLLKRDEALETLRYRLRAIDNNIKEQKKNASAQMSDEDKESLLQMWLQTGQAPPHLNAGQVLALADYAKQKKVELPKVPALQPQVSTQVQTTPGILGPQTKATTTIRQRATTPTKGQRKTNSSGDTVEWDGQKWVLVQPSTP